MNLAKRLNEVQTKPVKLILTALKKNDRALLQMATGTGKTNTAIKVFQKLYSQDKKVRILWLTHLAELAQQSYLSFQKNAKLTPWVDIGLFSGKHRDTSAPVIVATVQSISKKDNLELFESTDFDYIFVDEAHHVPAKTWAKVLEHFPKAGKFGFTATPARPDDKEGAVATVEIFGEPVFELSYKEACKKKLVAKAEGWLILTDSNIQPKFDANGDFAKSSLDRLWTTHGRQETILNAYKKYGRREMKKMGLPFKTVCYCINTNHAENMVKLFNKELGEGIAEILVGSSKVLSPIQREKVFANFAHSDKTEILCVVNIFNEGVDLPGIGCLIMARPTKSNIVYCQQLGRGVRRIDRKKEKVVVLDFVDNAEKEFLGYTVSNVENRGVSPRRIVTEFLKDPDPVKVERRILDLTASVEKFDNQFRQPNGYWTLEKCKKSALSYNSRSEWSIKEPSAYIIALRNGWLDVCCQHMRHLYNPGLRKKEIIDFIAKYGRKPSQNVQDSVERKLAQVLNHYTSPRSTVFDPKFRTKIEKMCGKIASGTSKWTKNLDTGRVFPSSASAAKSINKHRGYIAHAILKGYKCGGYRWAYCDENGKVIKNKKKE
jgi:superfamily II DNA or RNA helicase